MSETIAIDVLAVGAHPDDVELGCGGTLAQLVAAGKKCSIVHLTRGELGTRGNGETRQQEALAAARVLGVEETVFLDCGDGGLRHGAEQEDQVIELVRGYRPSIVLLPPRRDRHPDHERAHRLVRDACFYAGLVKRSPGGRPPHRPPLLLSYALHEMIAPTVIVDVSAFWDRKLAALRAYRSQFTTDPFAAPEHAADAAPETFVSRPGFWAAIEARARVWGQRIGVEFGEPLAAHDPLAVSSAARLFALIEQGAHRAVTASSSEIPQ